MKNTDQQIDEIVSDLIIDLTDTINWEAVSAGVKAGLELRKVLENEVIGARISILKKVKNKKPNAELEDQTSDYLRGYRECQSKIGFEINRLQKMVSHGVNTDG